MESWSPGGTPRWEPDYGSQLCFYPSAGTRPPAEPPVAVTIASPLPGGVKMQSVKFKCDFPVSSLGAVMWRLPDQARRAHSTR